MASISSLTEAGIFTSEQLVKTLRTPQPQLNKVSIAAQAWRQDHLIVPKKAELISRWTLEHLCSSLKSANASSKGKEVIQSSVSAPEFDLEAWELLQHVIQSQMSTTTTTEAARRSWLSSLAVTQPVLLLASAIANQPTEPRWSATPSNRLALLQVSTSALEQLLPSSSSRLAATNIESVTDTIQAWLEFLSSSKNSAEKACAHSILQAVVPSWSTALQYGSNAKRNHQHFTANCIEPLLRAFHQLQTPQDIPSASPDLALLDTVEQVGSQSLFTNESLRAILQASHSTSVTENANWAQSKSSPTGVIAKVAAPLNPTGNTDLIIATLHTLPSLCSLLHDKLTRCEALVSIAHSSDSSILPKEAQQLLVRKAMLSEFLFPISACMARLTDYGFTQASHLAEARKGLLQHIEKHNLYVSGSTEHEEWRSLLDTFFQVTHKDLRAAVLLPDSPDKSSQMRHQFDSLSSLWHLEKCVVEDDLISIFALAAVQPVVKPKLELAEQLEPTTMAALVFFRSVAEVYAKFRSVPTLLSILLRSMHAAADVAIQGKISSLQGGLFGSQTFLSELGKLCRDAVMPVQVADTVRILLSDTQSITTVGEAVQSWKPRKKQRQSQVSSAPSWGGIPPAVAPSEPKEVLAVIGQLHIVAQVLQSVSIVPTLRADCLQAVQILHAELLIPSLDLGLEQALKSGHGSGVHGVAAAALHARQSLLSDKWRFDSSEPVRLDGGRSIESLPFLETDFDSRADSLLELIGVPKTRNENPGVLQFQVTILHAILQRAERDLLLGRAETSPYCQQIEKDSGVVSTIADDLLTMLRKKKPSTYNYTGTLTSIKDRETLSRALWTVLVTRWAGVLESLASLKTLSNLARVLVGTATLWSRKDTMGFVSTSALKDASFLELTRWRAQILDCIQTDINTKSSRAQDGIRKRLVAASVLSNAPVNWVSKAHRNPLLNSLLELDLDVSAADEGGMSFFLEWEYMRLCIARFLGESSWSLTFSYEVFGKWLLSLVPPGGIVSSSDRLQLFVSATLTTFEAGIRLLHTRATKFAEAQSAFGTVLSTLQKEERLLSVHPRNFVDLGLTALQRIYDILVEDQTLTIVSSDDVSVRIALVRKSLYRIGQDTEPSKSPEQGVLDWCAFHLREVRLNVGMIRRAGAGALPADLRSELTATLKPICLTIRRVDSSWLWPSDAVTEIISEYLRCANVIGNSSSEGHYAVEGGQSSHLTPYSVCLAHVALNVATPPHVSTNKKQISSTLAHIIEQLSAEEYNKVLVQLLSLLSDTISSNDLGDKDQAALISTVAIVLCNGPQTTSQIAKTHLSSLLGLLVVKSARSGNALDVLLSIVNALEMACSSKAMLLRSQDLAMLLQLFEAIFAPSMTDEPQLQAKPTSDTSKTKTALFMGIVACLGSIIRLRQDLVLTSLPQLAALLSRMCALFRRVRTTSALQGSGLYNRQLRRDLPSWLDPLTVEPLQATPEARAFSRLLAGLTVKNIALGSGSEASKAESLARPFSKHATHVLVAYLRALTSANTAVPTDVRTELEPGMLTLCSIIGYHQRDSAMVSMLDAAGKTLLKRLWKTYETQRYKGE